MGCGSSSTAVQTFRNPEDNRNYKSPDSNNHVQESPSRNSSAATKPSDKKKKSKRKSSSSSGSSSSSDSSSSQSKVGEDSRTNSASTKKTYTIQRTNSDVTHDNTNVTLTQNHDENENVASKAETNVLKFEYEIEEDNYVDQESFDAVKHHEEIQKQTFITGDPDENTSDDAINDSGLTKETALTKEKGAQSDYKLREEQEINDLELVALVIPEMDGTDRTFADYTIDDIIEHNNEVAGLDWFKYGRKIYSWHMMFPIIQERMVQYDKKTSEIEQPSDCYPVYRARQHGVTRKELAKMLAVCQIGICVDVPRDQYLSRMKKSAENTLEEDTGTDTFKDYRNQLSRWLADYPTNKVYNDIPDAEKDPNELAFPLPSDIQSDPYVLRQWTETWEEFDCLVPEDGAWTLDQLLNDDWGDTHELYAKVVQEKHDDGTLEPLDMNIDGDVAWVEIELDLCKTDTTTELQESIWNLRATRTNIDDPVWMAKRREELAMVLKKRYDRMQISYPVDDYMEFAQVLEKNWQEFQKLCDEEFIPPEGDVRKRINNSELKMDEIENVDGGDVIVSTGSANETPVLDGDIEGNAVIR